MKKVGVLMFILFLLVGCKKRESDFLSSVNAVKIRFGEEVISTINDPSYKSLIFYRRLRRGNLSVRTPMSYPIRLSMSFMKIIKWCIRSCLTERTPCVSLMGDFVLRWNMRGFH